MWEQARGILEDSLARILASLTNYLPAILAFVLILLLALASAWVVQALLRRSLVKLGFDQFVARWGLVELTEWSPARSPTLLIAATAYWTILLLGLMTSLSALSPTLATQLAMGLLSVLQHVFLSLVVLLTGIVIARFLARGVLITAVNMQIQSARLLSLGVKWLVLVFSGAMALEHLGIGGGIVRLAFGILFGGIVLAMALAVGLGSKEMVSRSWERQVSRSEEQEEQLHHQ